MPSKTQEPVWASWLGIVVVVLGLLLTVWHANEGMSLVIVGHPPFTVDNMPPPACDEDELVEEGLSMLECRQMALSVHNVSLSIPDWFQGFYVTLSFVGALIALFSIFVGIALIDYRRWSFSAAFLTLGALTCIDVASFISVTNAGPLVRQMYLWNLLVWFFIHLVMTVIALVGFQQVSNNQVPANLLNAQDLSEPVKGYNRTAVVAHWLMAVSIFFLFISSWWMLGLPLPSRAYQFRAFPFQLHKNLGITLVAVILLLLYVRFKHRPGLLSKKVMSPAMYKLAVVDHIILYVLILSCCVTGYMSSSYSGWGTTLWWLVELPNWGYDNEALNIFYSDIHLWTCWALLAVISMHISGALYHAFRSDGVIRRMLHL